MINKTVTISALLFLLAPYALPQTIPEAEVKPTINPVPVIKFEEETFDVGEIWEGEKASHTFTFKNDGAAILRIIKVTTSCGCTAAVLSSKEIAPGLTGEIKATFNTKRFRGKQSKTISVSTNDSEHSTVQLKIQATVKSAAAFKPRKLQFGQVTRGEGITRIIELTPDGGPIKITKLTVTPDIFTARVLQDEGAQTDEKVKEDTIRPVRIEVSVSSDAPIGRHNGNLTVRIDHPKISSLSARLYINIEGLLKFSPKMLFFDENAQKNRSVKKVRLNKSKGDEMKVIEVASTSPQFQAKTVIIKEGREFDVEIAMAPNVAPGRYQGEIIIKTDSPGQEEIKILVRSNIRKK
jgi:Protein of unknown function (DUF1573)